MYLGIALLCGAMVWTVLLRKRREKRKNGKNDVAALQKNSAK
jgi:hypothetical protein